MMRNHSPFLGSPTYPIDDDGNPICIYGLVSYGPKSCDEYSIHVRVQAYLDWIVENTEN